jgi:hypothetical protein
MDKAEGGVELPLTEHTARSLQFIAKSGIA